MLIFILLLIFGSQSFSLRARLPSHEVALSSYGPAPQVAGQRRAPPPRPRRSPQKKEDSGTPPPAVENSNGAGDPDDDKPIVFGVNFVPILATVVDEQGRVVSNLRPKDFQLSVDGRSKPIREVRRSETPATLVLLIDNSSSVSSERPRQTQAAVQFLRHVLRPTDLAAVYSISTVPTRVEGLTNDVAALVGKVEGFGKPEGATALFDAVAAAADYLSPQKGRKVIVVISDGEDTASDLDFDAALAKAQGADCQVYLVQTVSVDDPLRRNLMAEKAMDEFAAQTGGAVFRARETFDLNDALSRIADNLAGQYVLGYYDNQRDGKYHQLTVRVRARPNLRVLARKGYYSPKG